MLTLENHECLIRATEDTVEFVYGDETVDLTGKLKLFFEEDFLHVSLEEETFDKMPRLQKDAFLEALDVWVKELLRKATDGECFVTKRHDPVKVWVAYDSDDD